MIDPFAEDMLTLSEATRLVPGHPHVSTLWRWVNRGIRGRKLETICVGGVRRTSKQALVRFFDGITAAASGEPAILTSRQRDRAYREAKRELDRAGL